jgi:hypothetical protein
MLMLCLIGYGFWTNRENVMRADNFSVNLDWVGFNIITDMKQELSILFVSTFLFIAARRYNEHLDRLEAEYEEQQRNQQQQSE